MWHKDDVYALSWENIKFYHRCLQSWILTSNPSTPHATAKVACFMYSIKNGWRNWLFSLQLHLKNAFTQHDNQILHVMGFVMDFQ